MKETWKFYLRSCAVLILLIAIVAPGVTAYQKAHPQYIGWCDRVDFAGGDAYWEHDGHVLAAIAQSKDASGTTWWMARIEGADSFAIFLNRDDAVNWIETHKFVKIKPPPVTGWSGH